MSVYISRQTLIALSWPIDIGSDIIAYRVVAPPQPAVQGRTNT